MSHAVLRGFPSKAQLYLDDVLDSILKSKGIKDINRIGIADVIWFSMNRHRSKLFMINGSTGENFCYEEILKKSVKLARALTDKQLNGKIVLVALKNHECMATLYYGILFAGSVPFLVDPNNTLYEFNHFIALVRPSAIFCASYHAAIMEKVVRVIEDYSPDIVIADSIEKLQRYILDYSDDLDSFGVTDIDLGQPAIILPTSGSTGLPKAAMLGHKGLIAQLPTLWTYHNKFPRPTDLVMLVSTSQWMTHTNIMTSCPVYQIPILMTPAPTVEGILSLTSKYRPSWTLLGPAFANVLASSAPEGNLTSLRTVLTTGAQPSPEIMKILKEKLSHNVHLCNGYGMTETHGFASMPDVNTPYKSTGRVMNILDYKLVNESGDKVGSNEIGELCFQSSHCILQGYYNNTEAHKGCMTDDGWYKTGDIFYEDYNGCLYFKERKKFWFKYLNYQISPEELETVIGSLPGVAECVVAETYGGATAAVVPRMGFALSVADVHRVINDTLSDYKRLHGGVVLVNRLPRTHSGKLHRAQCSQLINKLIGEQTANIYQ